MDQQREEVSSRSTFSTDNAPVNSEVPPLPYSADLSLHATTLLKHALNEWNDTDVAYAQEYFVHQLFAMQAARTPQAEALVCGQQRWTYRELDEQASKIASYLRSRGVGPEVCVGICMERSPELLAAVLGVLMAGGAYVPLDPGYPVERLAFMLSDAQVSLLLTQSHLRDSLPAFSGTIVCLDEMTLPSSVAPANEIHGMNLAYVIYTSGSTGRPKGVMNTHGGLLNRLLWMQDRFHLSAEDRVLQKTPISFDVSVWELFWPLMTGACLVLARPGGHQDAQYLLEVLIQERITTIHFVPSMLQAFLETTDLSEKIPSLKRVICSGEALSPALLGRCRQKLLAEIYNLYGPTEATIDVTCWPCTENDVDTAFVAIGRPIANTQIYLLDPALQPVAVGVPGELYIGGVQVARGYLHRPDLTAERFLPDPFSKTTASRLYRTGDLARYREDGAIEYLGRLDQQIKLRGYRIELGEIETVLAQHEALQEAVVVARSYPTEDKRLVAYVVPDASRALLVRRQLLLEQSGSLADHSLYELPNGMLIVHLNKSETDFLYHEHFEEMQLGQQYGIVLKDGACIFDVGANIGLFSLQAGLHCHAARIYAFEPVPAAAEVLRLNTQLYGLHAHVFASALAESSGYKTLTYYPHVSILSGSFADPLEEREVVRAFLLNQQTANTGETDLSPEALDELLEERLQGVSLTCPVKTLSEVMHEQGITSIDLLKIDVEKSEEDVLAGIQLEDWGKIQQVIMEVSDIAGRLDRIVTRLQQQGYDVAVEQEGLLRQTKLYTVYARRPTYTQTLVANPQQQHDHQDKYRWCSKNLLLKDVRQFLKARLPEYMVPAAIVVMDNMPLTASGKVDRRALPEPSREDLIVSRDFVAPRTPVERTLAELWSRILGLERIGRTDNFFESGGHSLLATQLLSRLRAHMHVHLSIPAIFAHPTLEDMAQIIERHQQEATTLQQPPIQPVARTGQHPLSYAQEQVWFLQRLDPTNMAYCFQATLRLTGTLDREKWERSLNEIMRRHEIFRTAFEERDGKPVQVIYPHQPLILPVLDLRSLQEDEREATAQQLIYEEFRKPFDITRRPLIRWTLLHLRPQEYIMLHVEHHLVHDGWSFNRFLGELATLYRADTLESSLTLPPLSLQFVDFAHWQRQWMQSAEASAQFAYWKQKLAHSPAMLELPTDRRRPAVQRHRGALHRVELPLSLYREARDYCRQEGITLFMFLFSVFLVLLYRYTGQEDLCVGTGIANRRWHETEEIIGMIINMLVLRTDLSGLPTFRQLLKRVREVTLEAYAAQDFPFSKLVAALQPERSLSYSPLYQVAFSFHDSPLPDLHLPALHVEIHEGLSNGSAKFDLNVIVIPRAEQQIKSGSAESETPCIMLWEYNTDLFDSSTVLRMFEQYQMLLQNSIARPEQRIDRIPLLSPSERHALLFTWNDTLTDYPRTSTLPQLCEAQAEQRPDTLALIFGEEMWTYNQLNEQANRLAHYLCQQGIRQECPVGLYMERSANAIISMLAILKAGGAYVPLDTSYPAERLAFLLSDASITLLLTEQRFLAQLPPYTGKIVCLDDGNAAIRQQSCTNVACQIDSQMLAHIIYTSGSTGRAKGIGITHRSVIRTVCNSNYLTVEPATHFAHTATISFDAATFETWASLLNGATLVGLDRETLLSSDALAAAIRNYQPATLFLTTALFNQMAGMNPQTLCKPDSLLFGGEAADPVSINKVLAAGGPRHLLNMYGPTESTVMATFYPIHGLAENAHSVPIGRPLANTQVYALDRQLQPVPLGVTGELYIGGDGLARGYINRPELTAAAFIPHPFSTVSGARLYKTGDLVRVLPDGALEFMGRGDFQVKLRGFRIELGEIESVLTSHPFINNSLVVLREDTPDKKQLVAYVVAQEDAELTSSQLRTFLQAHLPDYMIPTHFMLLPQLPLTPHGKIDRRALPIPDGSDTITEETFVAPRSSLEEEIAVIWRDVLQIQRIGIYDNFFEIGGHSLLGAQVNARLRNAFQVELPLRTLFENSTIASLATAVLQQQAEATDDALVLRLLEELDQSLEERS